jgi:hypothetical protein
MKLKCMLTFATLVLATTVGVRSAHAESSEIEKANIPFDFYAGNQKMPAGTYYFALDLTAETVMISDNTGHYLRFLSGSPAGQGGDKWALVFDHVGKSYFLKEFESDLQDVSFSVKKTENSKGTNTASTHVVVSVTRS